MNKTELVEAVAEKTGTSKKQASAVLEAILDTVTEQLASDQAVALVGFGTFSVKKRSARQGVNPRTGESIQIKKANVPGFKSGKSLKDACNSILEAVD